MPMWLASMARRGGRSTIGEQIRNGRLVLPERLAALPPFAALVVDHAREPVAAAAGVELVMDGIVIRAGADADEQHLARVIRAVRAAAR